MGYGLPGNSQRNDTYADQLRHMAAPGCGGQKLTDSAVDRWVAGVVRGERVGSTSSYWHGLLVNSRHDTFARQLCHME